MMQFPPGLQPFRPSPSTESFLASLLLDVSMEEKSRDLGYIPADVPRMSVLGANGEQRYGGTLPLASSVLSLKQLLQLLKWKMHCVDVCSASKTVNIERPFRLRIGYQYLIFAPRVLSGE